MGTCSGYTALICVASGCGLTDDATVGGLALATVREAVRRSRHGVLVSTGCLLGADGCGRRPRAPLVVVQPCDADRMPSARCLWIGPLRTSDDVAALGAWLYAGDLDPDLLPTHLLRLGTQGPEPARRPR